MLSGALFTLICRALVATALRKRADNAGRRLRRGALAGLVALVRVVGLPGPMGANAALARGPLDADAKVFEKTLDLSLEPQFSDADLGAPRPDQRPFLRDQPLALPAVVPDILRDADGKMELRPRVVEGSPAEEGAWPYAVNIAIEHSGKPFHICGGTVVGSRWVLTAGHCVMDSASGVLQLRAITAFINARSNIQLGGEKRRVTSVKVHPDYREVIFQRGRIALDDVALLELAEPTSAQRAKLTAATGRSAFLAPGTKGTLIGWGHTQFMGQASKQLLQATLPVAAQDVCDSWRSVGGAHLATKEGFCAGSGRATGSVSCNGDSGGPLFVPGLAGEPVQAGVVSWGRGCREYGVFGSVSNFEQWIRKHVPDVYFTVPSPASVTPALSTIAGAVAGGPAAPHGQCSVDVYVGGQAANRVKVGSAITVRVTSGMAGKLAVYNRSADGRARQLFPGLRGGRAGGAVRAGETLDFAGAGNGLPVGRYQIAALCLPPDFDLQKFTGRLLEPVEDFQGLLARIAEETLRHAEAAPGTPRAVATRQFEIVP